MIKVREELGCENLIQEFKGKIYVEKWIDIEGYEGIYQVSSFGRIKNSVKNKILKPHYNDDYIRINLTKHKKIKNESVHRIVTKAFVLNPENKPEVNHIDEMKDNNFYLNLEWCTRKENVNYGVSNINRQKNSRQMIYQKDLRGNTIKTWYSCTDLLKNKYDVDSIMNACCVGSRESYKGYNWGYLDV